MNYSFIYRILMLFWVALPSVAMAQNLVSQDSILLNKNSEMDDEIKINADALGELNALFNPELQPARQKNFAFDITLPKVYEMKENSLLWPHIELSTMKFLNDQKLTGILKSKTLFMEGSYRGGTNKIKVYSKQELPYDNSYIKMRSELQYKISKKLSLLVSGQYDTNKYRNPLLDGSIYRAQFGTDALYQLNKNFFLKIGMHYQYNNWSGKWEWAYMNGIVLKF